MAETKPRKKSARIPNCVITPKVKPDHGVNFTSLKAGTFFMMRNCLWQKTGGYSQCAQNISTGNIMRNLCGTFVVPVMVAIQWKEK